MRRTSAVLAATALAVTGALSASGAGASTAAGAPPLTRVIVQGASVAAAADAVRAAGGRVLQPLPIVDGVAAELPAGRVPTGVVVTPDASVTMDGGVGGTEDPTTKSVYRYETGADALGPATFTGAQAPAVAVIDTGIDTGTASQPNQLADNVRSVPDPFKEGATVPCANFSTEPGCQDSYGHGTFMAGIIAGDQGMAPNAKLVSVKIAGRSGSADVSQLLAAIQYVVSFREDLNIKVLNLSLGSNSTNDYRTDPVNRAVQKAWQSGITVVVSASNRGPAAQTISKPADDPLVLTVGAVDDRQTPSVTDDTVPAFSGRGPVTFSSGVSIAKPDVAAPGVGIISLNVAGSYIDQVAGPSRYPVPGYRRGSGTSQAAAVVSGAAALMLERAALTPDEVKQSLKTTTTAVTGTPDAVGAGLINVARALSSPARGFTQAPVGASDTLSGLDASRGQLLVTSGAGCGPAPAYYRTFVDSRCDYVHGDEATNGAMFDREEYASQDTWSGQSWYASQWVQGQSWYGQSWYGQSWYGQSWYGQSWYGYGGSTPPTEGTSTPLGTVLKGSAFYGVWG